MKKLIKVIYKPLTDVCIFLLKPGDSQIKVAHVKTLGKSLETEINANKIISRNSEQE